VPGRHNAAMKNLSLLLAAALALVTTGALAQAPATATGSADAQAATFRCGGVGEDDQKRMKAEAAQHGVLVTFSTTDGAYVADVGVEIRQGGKSVLQGRCNGPLMLVDLPQGSYEIAATAQGRTQRKTLTVGGKPAAVGFSWGS